jgi:hypothetical protein
VWLTAKKRDTGDPVSQGFWNDVESVNIPVVDGLTGAAATRNFIAAGGLIDIGPIPLTSDLSIRSVDVTLSPLNVDVEQYVRGYDLRMAPVQLYRAIFDPDTWDLVANATPRFVGFVEKAPITTPKDGGDAKAVLSCVSHTVELTRGNPDVRSDESQKRRGGDRFYQYVDTMAQRPIWWGSNLK